LGLRPWHWHWPVKEIQFFSYNLSKLRCSKKRNDCFSQKNSFVTIFYSMTFIRIFFSRPSPHCLAFICKQWVAPAGSIWENWKKQKFFRKLLSPHSEEPVLHTYDSRPEVSFRVKFRVAPRGQGPLLAPRSPPGVNLLDLRGERRGERFPQGSKFTPRGYLSPLWANSCQNKPKTNQVPNRSIWTHFSYFNFQQGLLMLIISRPPSM
jgi:hypothetical protein